MNEDQMAIPVSESGLRILERFRVDRGFATTADCLDDLLERAEAARPRSLTLDIENRRYVLTRLDDQLFCDLSKSTIAISQFQDILLHQMGRDAAKPAETYASCCRLFGERGRLFDDWKGAFSFPLSIAIRGVDFEPAFLLNLYDYRGGIEYRLQQTVAADDPRLLTNYLYSYDDRPLPGSDLTQMLFYLIGFLEGYISTCGWTTPFVLAVPASNLAYGFSQEDGFFNRHFEASEEFDAAVTQLACDLPTPGFY